MRCSSCGCADGRSGGSGGRPSGPGPATPDLLPRLLPKRPTCKRRRMKTNEVELDLRGGAGIAPSAAAVAPAPASAPDARSTALAKVEPCCLGSPCAAKGEPPVPLAPALDAACGAGGRSPSDDTAAAAAAAAAASSVGASGGEGPDQLADLRPRDGNGSRCCPALLPPPPGRRSEAAVV